MISLHVTIIYVTTVTVMVSLWWRLYIMGSWCLILSQLCIQWHYTSSLLPTMVEYLCLGNWQITTNQGLWQGLPWWLSGKEFTSSTGATGSIPGSGRSPGGGHGNPLQYSCLENPLDRGAWWETVHRVAKSQTRLKRLSVHTCRVGKL